MKRNSFLFKFIGFLFVAALTISGCKEDGIVETVPVGYTSYEDAAVSIPAAVGDTTCGIIDIIGDISEFATLNATNSRSTSTETFTTIFTDSVKINDTTWTQKHTWTGVLTRTKSDPAHSCSSTIERTYEWIYYKTINGTETKLLNYIVGSDTAEKITLNILRGTGYALTPQIHQNVYSVSGSWIITKTNTDTLSMDGTIYQSAFDTLLTKNIMRTVNGQMSINLTVVKANRLQGRASIAIPFLPGAYAVTVAFPKGQQQYNDVAFSRNFFVRFNSGSADDINIGGMIWHGDALLGTLN
jgi:hypothetical protein